MDGKKKPAGGGIPQAGYGAASADRKPPATASRIKAVIVRLAVWGLIPSTMAEWIIRHGGLRDA